MTVKIDNDILSFSDNQRTVIAVVLIILIECNYFSGACRIYRRLKSCPIVSPFCKQMNITCYGYLVAGVQFTSAACYPPTFKRLALRIGSFKGTFRDHIFSIVCDFDRRHLPGSAEGIELDRVFIIPLSIYRGIPCDLNRITGLKDISCIFDFPADKRAATIRLKSRLRQNIRCQSSCLAQ